MIMTVDKEKRQDKANSRAEQAIENADPGLLAAALLEGTDPNHRFDDGETLVHRACAPDIPVMVTMLLQKGAA